MTPFQILPKSVIRAWLTALVQKADGREVRTMKREGVTIQAIASHTGIPLDTLRWIRADTGRMSRERQMLLSKVIAQVENGQLEFVRKTGWQGGGKIGVLVDKPKVIARYGWTFGPRGPSLKALDRPAPYQPMPSFKDVLLK